VLWAIYKWPLSVFLTKLTGYGFLFVYFNSFLWFIWAILIFYLVSPLIYYIFEKSKNRGIVTANIILWYIVIVNFIDRNLPWDIWEYFRMTNRFPIYLFGMYLGYEFISGRAGEKSEGLPESHTDGKGCSIGVVTILLAVLIMGNFLLYETVIPGKWFLVPNSSTLAPAAATALALVLLYALLMEKLERGSSVLLKIRQIILKVLEFFGVISLEFYVVQEHTRELLLPIISIEGRANSMKFNIICFVVCIILAEILLYVSRFVSGLIRKCVERPAKQTA